MDAPRLLLTRLLRTPIRYVNPATRAPGDCESMASTQFTALCTSCSVMLKDRGSDQQYGPTNPANSSMFFQKHCANGLREMIEASPEGCDICKTFLSCLTLQEIHGVVMYSRSHDVEDKATYYSIERIDRKQDWPMEHFRLTFLWPSFANSEASSSVMGGRLRKTFKIMPAAPLPSEKIINPLSRRAQNAAESNGVEPRNLTGMPTSTSTWSPAEIKLAKIWIDICIQSHECGRNAPAQYVPSRLIHIGSCESALASGFVND